MNPFESKYDDEEGLSDTTTLVYFPRRRIAIGKEALSSIEAASRKIKSSPGLKAKVVAYSAPAESQSKIQLELIANKRARRVIHLLQEFGVEDENLSFSAVAVSDLPDSPNFRRVDITFWNATQKG